MRLHDSLYYKILYTHSLFLCVCLILCTVTYFSNFHPVISTRPSLRGRRDTLPHWFIFVHLVYFCTFANAIQLQNGMWHFSFAWHKILVWVYQLFIFPCLVVLFNVTSQMFECIRSRLLGGTSNKKLQPSSWIKSKQKSSCGTNGDNLKLHFLTSNTSVLLCTLVKTSIMSV